jgi:uridine kinase
LFRATHEKQYEKIEHTALPKTKTPTVSVLELTPQPDVATMPPNDAARTNNMNDRQRLIAQVAATITRLPANGVLRVGIDGVDGAGKSMFGDELAAALTTIGRHVIRASVDGFHNPRTLRYRQGRSSPLGYFEDSYNYAQLNAVLLAPLGPGGTGCYRTAIFDHRADAPVALPEHRAAPGDILVFDGIFLHRPELRTCWDFSIFLDIATATSVQRCAHRDGTPPEMHAPENQRYIAGQQHYLATCTPQHYATLVINNDDLAAPRLIEGALQPEI